ncbi:hypothetical protein M413DRAFT_232898 [Hebeloma cylindrosporum]|uniref:PEBP-like protein n=1 Tax=Hebeloma cylindrosporum TaxID=76867 RepID=A0A0C3CIB5_HEBCY|nr:hypothetical protein M413DRAFT_232898 [Hebeloma cylindrosporum h7]
MFAIRKVPHGLPRSLARVSRGNATVAVNSAAPQASEPTPPPPEAPPVAKTEGRKRKKILPKRPPISLESPRKWARPLKSGVLPAYDLALRVLKRDSENLKAEAAELRVRIAEVQSVYAELEGKLQALREDASVGLEAKVAARQRLEEVDSELEGMLQKVNILEVQSQINLPSVRWTVSNAMADMSNLSHRHLVEQKWRKDGDLDLLMERIYQLNVVPDVLPVLKPSIDLHVIARTTPKEFLTSKKVQSVVEPGVFLRSKQTMTPPKLRVNVFHTDVRLYTMLLVDPDVPNPESESFTTFLHWMKPNIALSATSPSLLNLNTHTKYIPPHPQRGTPYHRYVTLLLPQPPIGSSDYTLAAASRAGDIPTSMHLDIPVVPDAERLGFDVRAFVQKWNLNGAKGGGAHLWREVWDENVSQIYKDVLNKPEPHYGRPPKVDPYAEIKQKKKYIL